MLKCVFIKYKGLFISHIVKTKMAGEASIQGISNHDFNLFFLE